LRPKCSRNVKLGRHDDLIDVKFRLTLPGAAQRKIALLSRDTAELRKQSLFDRIEEVGRDHTAVVASA